MHLTHNILVVLLALIFAIAGLSKVAGSPKGLSGTRDLGVKDFIARSVGAVWLVRFSCTPRLRN